jgi:choline dehydrogenase
MGGLVRTRPDAPRPDCQLYFSPASYTISTPGKRQLFKPDPFPGFLLSFNPCRPTSTGRIDIVSPDPTIPPAIRPNSLSTNKDLDDVVAGARLIRALRNTAAMRALIEAPHGFDVADANDEAVVADFRKRAGTVYHPTCTCRMAPAAKGGVVDHRLRVHGVEGLRIADASVFPNVTSANTNAPTIMLAFKAAAMIADDNRSRS